MNSLYPTFYALLILFFPYIGKYKYSRQSLSSIAISLGLLGTFIGIIYGLMNFNTEQIGPSVAIMLESLKLAILTTLAGLFTSILLKLFPSLYGIKQEKITESDPVTENILGILTEISQNTSNRNTNSIAPAVTSSPDSKILQELFDQQTVFIENIKQKDHLQNNQLEQILHLMQEMNDHLVSSQKNLESINPDFSKVLAEQMGKLTILVKNNEEQLRQQIDQMEEKRLQEAKELENLTKTITSIIKKLNQDHNALHKASDISSQY